MGIDRGELVAHLVDEAQRRWPQCITFHWEAPLAGIDTPAKRACFV